MTLQEDSGHISSDAQTAHVAMVHYGMVSTISKKTGPNIHRMISFAFIIFEADTYTQRLKR